MSSDTQHIRTLVRVATWYLDARPDNLPAEQHRLILDAMEWARTRGAGPVPEIAHAAVTHLPAVPSAAAWDQVTAIVGPQDVLVIRVGPGVDSQKFDVFADHLKASMPDQMRGRVLMVDAAQLGVVRPVG